MTNIPHSNEPLAQAAWTLKGTMPGGGPEACPRPRPPPPSSARGPWRSGVRQAQHRGGKALLRAPLRGP